jgi:class 3 adenylate cyclase
VPVLPETRYARSGDISIAYQVVGEGPLDVVYVPPFVSNVELDWQIPAQAAFYEQLSSFCRLIRFDKRGTGMSDRMAGVPTLETRMDDVRAVMDAVGSSRAALIGASEGGPMSILFAAAYPHRVWALVLWSTSPRLLWAPDYPDGITEERFRNELEDDRRFWSDPKAMEGLAAALAPSADLVNRQALAASIRQSASPGAVEALNLMNREIDVRSALSSISVPTLVMNRVGDEPFNVKGSRYLAAEIPGAQHIELPGSDHAVFTGDAARVVGELKKFLGASWEGFGDQEPEPDRVLATVLFTDIVGSSEKAASLGDRAWRDHLERHHELVRRQLARFRGKEVDTAGDGFFASFDGPARAIRCASAIVEAMPEMGLDVRAGLHTGECELVDGKVAGIAVHTGARVASQAEAGEVLVSSTVKDLVAGSGIGFQERGTHELKGIPGEWRLYAVED